MEIDRLGALHMQAVWILLVPSNFSNLPQLRLALPEAQRLPACSCWREAEPSGTFQETRTHASKCSRSVCGELREVLEGLKSEACYGEVTPRTTVVEAASIPRAGGVVARESRFPGAQSPQRLGMLELWKVLDGAGPQRK